MIEPLKYSLASIIFFTTLYLILFQFLQNNCEQSTNIPTQKKIKGYIISFNDKRWDYSAKELANAGITPIRVEPVPYKESFIQLDGDFENHPELNDLQKTLSNKFSHRKAWNLIATDPEIPYDGYGLVFENDIVYNNNIPYDIALLLIEKAANLSNPKTGIFYLGVCNPKYNEELHEIFKNVEFMKGIGSCAHAYGIFKKHAMFYYDKLAAILRNDTKFYPGTSTYYLFMDAYLRDGHERQQNSTWPVVISPPHDNRAESDHFGMFNQYRSLFPSEITNNSNNKRKKK